MNPMTTLISTLCVMLLYVCTSQAHGAENVFTIADDQDATPYIFASSAGRPEGIFHDITVNAFTRMQVPLQYNVYPWKRAQLLVQSKKADALITIPTPKRLRYLVSEPGTSFRHAI